MMGQRRRGRGGIGVKGGEKRGGGEDRTCLLCYWYTKEASEGRMHRDI
jgi:hypothetical protein